MIASRDWGSEDAYLLEKIAMAEAEGEDTEGKALVMLVVLNRVWSDKFPDTISDVIFQEGAFTSISNGRYDRVEPNNDCYAAMELITTGQWDGSNGGFILREPATRRHGIAVTFRSCSLMETIHFIRSTNNGSYILQGRRACKTG